jgi:hypothetical protein
LSKLLGANWDFTWKINSIICVRFVSLI